MNIAEIQTALDEIAAQMVEKGVVEPTSDFTMQNGGRLYVYLRGKYDTKPFHGKDSTFVRGDTAEEVIAEARKIVSELPPPEETTTREYLSRVASAIDYATENSIADEYVAPLRGVSCAMTDNLLTTGATS